MKGERMQNKQRSEEKEEDEEEKRGRRASKGTTLLADVRLQREAEETQHHIRLSESERVCE